MPKAIVITIDQLGARYLSPYGNTWNPTPGFDNLAASGMTAEYCLSSSTCPEASMQSLLTGQHPMASKPQTSLLQNIAELGQSSLLIQDGDSISGMDCCQDFSEIKSIPAPIVSEMAESLEYTACAQFVSLVMKELEQGITHDLTWIHYSSLGVLWDAPLPYREQFFGDEDPAVANLTEPPTGPLLDPDDPDEIMQVVHAYAAQISVLDACLALLIDQIEHIANTLDEPTLLLITSPRSQALGHHGGVGYHHSEPATDQLHVPLFITKLVPQNSDIMPAPLSRNSELLQPECVFATLSHWMTGQNPDCILSSHRSQLRNLEFPSHTAAPPARQFTLSRFANGMLGLQSPAWFSTTNLNGGTRLFVKPDDRWESNEIADRRQDIVEEFEALFESPIKLLTQPIDLPASLQKQG